jgi:hypothetical protein
VRTVAPWTAFVGACIVVFGAYAGSAATVGDDGAHAAWDAVLVGAVAFAAWALSGAVVRGVADAIPRRWLVVGAAASLAIGLVMWASPFTELLDEAHFRTHAAFAAVAAAAGAGPSARADVRFVAAVFVAPALAIGLLVLGGIAFARPCEVGATCAGRGDLASTAAIAGAGVAVGVSWLRAVARTDPA